MKECKCSMRTKLVGDGCEVCNPELALEYAGQTIADLKEELAEQAAVIEKIFAHMQERVDIERSKAASTTNFSMRQVASTHADTVRLILNECRDIPTNSAEILAKHDATVLRGYQARFDDGEIKALFDYLADEKDKP